MKLSRNFELREFVLSNTATRLGLDNTPSQVAIANLKTLCEKVLQPVRDHYDSPVIISSGYRSKAVNASVGGSPRSEHLVGKAADFNVQGVDPFDVCIWIRSTLDFNQLIYEFNSWVHVSYSIPNSQHSLTINRNGTFAGIIR